MSYHSGDTICAVATAAGGAARGMVRVSGQDAVAIVARCFSADDRTPLDQITEARAMAGKIRLAVTERSGSSRPLSPSADRSAETCLPCDAFIWPTHRSYTREPVVELHTFGSPPLLEAVLGAVCSAGARLAEPGEFTLRAFLAGRLDLTQAEAVLSVIDARDESQFGAALAQLAGGLGAPLHQLRDDLLQLLAELEAGLDFVDEDIEFISPEEITRRAAAASRLLDEVAGQMSTRHTSSGHPQIALVGPPNVGKSSLFNALVARYGVSDDLNPPRSVTALVSPQRGTTRDYLTATISLDGMRCELIDTAGVGEADSDVHLSPPSQSASVVASAEAAAQMMATKRRERALIRLHCIDASGFAGADRARFACNDANGASGDDVLVLTKSDLPNRPDWLPHGIKPDDGAIATSSRTGEGLAELVAALLKLLAGDHAAHPGQVIAATANRCRESIRLAKAAVENAAILVTSRAGDELIAVELRAAVNELGKVLGTVYTDDLLDRIFKTFCIGK